MKTEEVEKRAIKVDPQTHRAAKIQAATECCTIGEIAAKAIQEYVAKQEAKVGSASQLGSAKPNRTFAVKR